MPGRLLTSKKIKTSSVSRVGRVFDGRGDAKAKEKRVHFYFPTANVPVSRPHALGRKPTGYSIVGGPRRDPAAGAPGVIYDVFPNASRSYITLRCSTAQTWAEIIVH